MAVVGVAIWMAVSIKTEWGTFAFIAFDIREKKIAAAYDPENRKGEIVFYGASNFRLWKEMDEDMKPFVVQNHGFGGSTDNDLIERADKLLYPYKPAIVVFQTGSNDYSKYSGSDDEIAEKVIENKKKMFTVFHEKLPDAAFVVVSGILMPGRSKYDGIVKKVNAFLSSYCGENGYMYYVDAEEMTVDESGAHIKDMFIADGIHLTHESRIRWADEYIKPALEKVIKDRAELAYIKEIK